MASAVLGVVLKNVVPEAAKSGSSFELAAILPIAELIDDRAGETVPVNRSK